MSHMFTFVSYVYEPILHVILEYHVHVQTRNHIIRGNNMNVESPFVTC